MRPTGKIIDYFMQIPEVSGLRAELRGNRCLCLEGCDGIGDYSKENITVNCGRMVIEILGRELSIAYFSRDAIIINGVIKSLSYSYKT